MINEFIRYLEAIKGYSQHTLTAYENDLNGFQGYLNFMGLELPAAQKHHVRSYVVQLKTEGITNRSINRKISALKSFYKYALKQGYIASNPVNGVTMLKTPKRLPIYVDTSKVDRLFYLSEDSFSDVRDRLVLIMLYMTGMRRGELVNTQLKDIDFNRKAISVVGKGNKNRFIPISPVLEKYLKHYLALKKDQFSEMIHDYLIVTDKGRPVYAKMIYNIANRFLKVNNLSEKQSPHVLRHTFATHLANNGADLVSIKDLLGHASLAATQVYTHNSIDVLKQAYARAHPKG